MDLKFTRRLTSEEKQALKEDIYTRLDLDLPLITHSIRKRRVLLSAAAAIIILLSGVLMYERKSPELSAPRFIATTKDGETRLVTLPDGSVVILNAGSSIEYIVNKASRSREVIITGNGFFKVKKDPLLPKFIVRAHTVNVSVLGTQFNVNARTPKVEVALTSGKVNVGWDRSDKVAAQMDPGDKVTTDITNHSFSIDRVDTLMYSPWTKGEWNFRNTTLSEMSGLILEYYGTTVVFSNQQSKKLRMTAVLPVTGLHNLVKVISETLQVPIKESGNQLFIQ